MLRAPKAEDAWWPEDAPRPAQNSLPAWAVLAILECEPPLLLGSRDEALEAVACIAGPMARSHGQIVVERDAPRAAPMETAGMPEASHSGPRIEAEPAEGVVETRARTAHGRTL